MEHHYTGGWVAKLSLTDIQSKLQYGEPKIIVLHENTDNILG
jgi:hypothetical protein